MEKRTSEMKLADMQEGNRLWWTKHTMSYDWREKIGHERFSSSWFDQIDTRFVHSARLFATDQKPFDKIIPFSSLSGKRVLEIGCGMGLHSELIIRAGANFSAIDLSATSVEATRKRLVLKGLDGDIKQADAENIPFEDHTFDFVWSWGVIHHSSRTARIVREISRVLKPGGECRVMVYNRLGVIVPIVYFKEHLAKGKFLQQDFDQTLLTSSDGFSARFYVPDQFADLFYAFFEEVSIQIFGQESDSLPFPAPIRKIALRFVPEGWMHRRQGKAGAFLFLNTAS